MIKWRPYIDLQSVLKAYNKPYTIHAFERRIKDEKSGDFSGRFI